ncbi:family 20 glycosylhydrolase [Elizabethkingia sp. JS20170427COW]|uniref:family 20 glycosylhydrolase n=1 Tax=Elizabethkingia sp. JS20170427COW TaxID=2583851 RepID=UPI001C88A334|nr:family 20 glycosylhydrolase [Elizabethkingia sp. JS20170427COW]
MKKIIIGLGVLVSSLVSAQENLIPQPEISIPQKGNLSLKKGISISEEFTAQEQNILQEIFHSWNIPVIQPSKKDRIPIIEFKFDKKNSDHLGKEGYRLEVNKKGITITAETSTGIFYALQTLRQLDLENQNLKAYTFIDRPSFSLRGFLVDVGRNYQPVDMLKEQIDMMAKYKLNVFHFHFTEDIAWRLESKKYPGLTDASNMTRWKGQFYTQQEFRELIDYCKERNILFLPEIDMPGHSKAFSRYFKVDMQSAEGMIYIKELLKEFKETYPDLEFLHIGGDEVKITNKDFMPEITRYVESLRFKNTIGWNPGSNLLTETYQQLWMGGAERILEQGETKSVDSKHLYLNHMDPLETVTTLYFRKFGLSDREHKNFPGAILCSWPDRAVAQPIDMFYQNAIYPGMLSFSERIWKGGGLNQWTANIPTDSASVKEFKDFEKRLEVHQKRYFKNLPFPYTPQSGMVWELVGPFSNHGNLETDFPIEKNPFSEAFKTSKTVIGGTVILRHWWANVIPGALENPQENTTWYARTKIWSDEDAEKDFWIGFNNLSRSYASDSPASGTWDDRKSEVWVNQKLVEPPHWQQAGMKGDLEKPLVNEGYTFRKPTKIRLKKGWNSVLLKLPVKDFKGKDWQNPEKWMFTFIEVQ